MHWKWTLDGDSTRRTPSAERSLIRRRPLSGRDIRSRLGRLPLGAMAVLFLLTGCALAAPAPTQAEIPPTLAPQATVPPAPTARPPEPTSNQTADVIFTNANVLTMDPLIPSARSVALRGERILAVGSEPDTAALRGPGTAVIDLDGRTLAPGFIDAHQHRIGNRALVSMDDPRQVIRLAVEQGLTTIDELYVDQGRVDELVALDEAGILRLHVNAYLPVNENSPEGALLGNYYQSYTPGQRLSPHVRVAGLKIFTDFDNATILLWEQEALNQFIVARLREGWPLAIKTVSTRSLEMILEAVEYASTVLPDVADRRIRLEHMLFATPEQIERIGRLGIVPIINLNNPGQLVGEPDVEALIAREPQGSYTPWRNLTDAGILFASATGWPSFYVEEPIGAPFGSPMHLIYQAATRVGNLGVQPYPWLLDQAITAGQAMRALTIDGAYADFEENEKGSLSPGKLADLAILSDDPMRLAPAQVNDIQVLVTMVGGRVEWCAPGSEGLCPGVEPAPAPAPTAVIDPFLGEWSATDPADGSAMVLRIEKSGNAYKVVLMDERAKSCGVDASGQPNVPAEVEATGTVSGAVLRTAVSELRCLTQPPVSRGLILTINYTYNDGADTLVDDSQGTVWHRK